MLNICYNPIRGLDSKGTMVLCQWGIEMNVCFVNRVDNIVKRFEC